MQNIIQWDALWSKLTSTEHINAKIEYLNHLDCLSGFEENHLYNICKCIYDDYYEIIKEDDNRLIKIRRELSDVFSRFNDVYSVNTRSKDIISLIQKIVLRRYKYYRNKEIGEKYRNISGETYKDVITDLIGVRVTVRSSEVFRSFDTQLKQLFAPRPRKYVSGLILPHEDVSIIAEYPVFKHPEFEVDKLNGYTDIYHLEPQDSGYRSVHYTLSRDGFYIELQLRTIFDDGWSECNHEYVYKKEGHSHYKILERLSKNLRETSSAANDFCSLMSDIYNNHSDEKPVIGLSKPDLNENEIQKVIDITEHLEKVVNQLKKLCIKEDQ